MDLKLPEQYHRLGNTLSNVSSWGPLQIQTTTIIRSLCTQADSAPDRSLVKLHQSPRYNHEAAKSLTLEMRTAVLIW